MTPAPKLRVLGGPFLHRGRSTRSLMWEVVAATVPVLAFATYHFGAVALWMTAACCAGALGIERLTRDPAAQGGLRDGSALISGVLLALSLPPSLPLWMAFLGGAVGVGCGKVVFGGLGHNPFNPALVGRAFLQAAFPTAMTTWTASGAGVAGLSTRVFAAPLSAAPSVDAVSAATPLGLSKFEHTTTAWQSLLWGETAGCLGETSAALLVAIGLWLGLRGVFDYRLALGTLASVALCSAALHAAAPSVCPPPAFMLLSGGLLLAAVFMVTDPVTTPVTAPGAWIFGAGTGALVVLIRVYGGLPEGVMYSVLLMNAVTPLIDRYTQPKPFGATVRS